MTHPAGSSVFLSKHRDLEGIPEPSVISTGATLSPHMGFSIFRYSEIRPDLHKILNATPFGYPNQLSIFQECRNFEEYAEHMAIMPKITITPQIDLIRSIPNLLKSSYESPKISQINQHNIWLYNVLLLCEYREFEEFPDQWEITAKTTLMLRLRMCECIYLQYSIKSILS